MTEELYSVEQVAERLGLHVRTVRGYIREGRLKAVRIGKQYRIAQADLDALTGGRVAVDPVRRTRHVEVSSVVDIEAVSPEAAMRITNGIVAVSNSHDESSGPTRVQTVYDESRGRLKIIVTGGLATVVGLLQLVGLYLEQPA